MGVAVVRSQFQCALAQADGPEGLLHFEYGVGFIAQCLNIVGAQVQNLVVGGDLVLLRGFLACLQPERVHFVGALNLGLVLMDDLGLLLQLFFNGLQALFVFHHQFVHTFLGQAGQLVTHVADGVPANDNQDGSGAGDQVEKVSHRVGGVGHGFVGHGQFLVHHFLDQFRPGILHLLAQCLGLLQQVKLHKRGIHGFFQGSCAFLYVFRGQLFFRAELLLLGISLAGKSERECEHEVIPDH